MLLPFLPPTIPSHGPAYQAPLQTRLRLLVICAPWPYQVTGKGFVRCQGFMSNYGQTAQNTLKTLQKVGHSGIPKRLR